MIDELNESPLPEVESESRENEIALETAPVDDDSLDADDTSEVDDSSDA